MIPLLTASQMQQVDRAAIEGLGLPGAVLMETAGRSVMEEIGRRELTAQCVRPLVLCGKGNNGGDGFVVARYLLDRSEEGFPIVFLCGRLKELKGDAALMARVAAACGVRIVELTGEKLPDLESALGQTDLIVDGLLGTGSAGAPRGLICKVIEMLGDHTPPMVAIDCPSGVQMDDGQAPGPAIRADLTVTFGFEKIGHRLYPGRGFCGEVRVADIGFPEAAQAGLECSVFLAEAQDVGIHLPPREPDSHKGDYGRVLVLGGSTGLTGAPVMTCESALACGAGLVTAGVPASLNPIFETKLTEAMSHPLADSGRGALIEEALEEIAGLLEKSVDVLALGPGLGRDESTQRLVRALAVRIAVPTVIDADGLNAFAGEPDALRGINGPVVITPHPGEMSRLCGLSVARVKAAPIEVAREFASRYGLVVLLKGSPTVIAQPDGLTVLNPTGGPALAKGGSGDVLTGVIAALLAQGLDTFTAAFCGAYLHGLSGDIAARKLGEYSVVATDLISTLPIAIGEVRGLTFGEG
jgi:ADP-dependent NAD(P)H-hydrate dehydratase / NAD(P)H-hydrate epimerase